MTIFRLDAARKVWSTLNFTLFGRISALSVIDDVLILQTRAYNKTQRESITTFYRFPLRYVLDAAPKCNTVDSRYKVPPRGRPIRTLYRVVPYIEGTLY
jgi:hypothetical protein